MNVFVDGFKSAEPPTKDGTSAATRCSMTLACCARRRVFRRRYFAELFEEVRRHLLLHELRVERGLVAALLQELGLACAPRGVLFFAVLRARLEEAIDLFGNEERRLEGPTGLLLRRLQRFVAERFAVRLLGVLLVWRADADVRARDDEVRLAATEDREIERRADLLGVVTVDVLHVPAVGFVALSDVLREREARVAVDRDVVVVVEEDDVVETEVRGEAAGFAADALHHVAVGGDAEDASREERCAPTIEARREHLERRRDADGVRNALPERPGGHLDAGCDVVLGMPRRLRTPLAEARLAGFRRAEGRSRRDEASNRGASTRARTTARSDRGPATSGSVGS